MKTLSEIQGCSKPIKVILTPALRATTILARHPHFRGRCRWIRCQVRDQCLELSGVLPSFYLKQLAQEALRDLEGVERIDNRIVVASPLGEISFPPPKISGPSQNPKSTSRAPR